MRRSRPGFVLLFALGLAFFTAVLAVLLLEGIQRNRLADGQELRSALARHYARLATQEALAQLRSVAGPDTVATARAELLPGVTAGRWIGVWSPDGNVTWLVSGASPDPTAAEQPDAIEVGGVLVPGVSMADAADHSAWEVVIGYWIDDEAQKASLRMPRTIDDLREDDSTKDRLRGQSFAQADLSGFFTEWPSDLPEDLLAAVLTSGESVGDLLRATEGAAELALVPRLRAQEFLQAADALTDSAKGVLANAAQGGLRHELSAPTHDTADRSPLVSWAESPDVTDFLATTLDEGRLLPRGVDENSPLLALGLVATEWGLYVRFFAAGVDALGVEVALRIDAWNPYTRELLFTPQGMADWFLEIEGLPPLVLRWADSRDPLIENTLTVDLASVVRESGVQEIDVWGENFFEAGQVRLVSEYREYAYPVGPATAPRWGDQVAVSWDAFEATVTFRDRAGRFLQRVEGLAFDAAEAVTAPVGLDGVIGLANFSWMWHYRLREEGRVPLAGWFADVDPLGPVLTATEERFVVGLQVAPLAASMPEAFASEDIFVRADGVGLPAQTHPLAPLTNVAFVARRSTSPKRFALLDQAYLAGGTDSMGQPRQVRMVPVDAAKPADALDPADWLVAGAFNVNSTSVEAWRAVLGGGLAYDVTLPWPGVTRPRLGYFLGEAAVDWGSVHSHPFTRNTGPESTSVREDTFYRTENSAFPWRNAWRTSLRELRAEQVEALAESIVAELENRGQPFPSLAAWAESDLLEQALARTSINTTSGQPEVAADPRYVFPRGSPARVTADDIVSALAPFASVRGDTFTIHAVAELRDRTTGTTLARTVQTTRAQRTPELENAVTSRRVFRVESAWSPPGE